MLNNYKQFNEARKHKNRKQHERSFNQRNTPTSPFKKYPRDNQNGGYPIVRGMPMDFTPRFRYIISKIATKNNRIAKELIEILNKPDAKFEYSYLDLTNRPDTLSYLPNGERNTPENERYTTNKRQHSKAYKIVKTIFGSKYTKNEVNKFVSMYKEIYEEGPPKQDTKAKKTQGQLLQTIINDTKNDKLKWQKIQEVPGMATYQSMIPVTDTKYIDFCYFTINNDDTKSFITVNFKTKGVTHGVWIASFKAVELIEFIPIFNKKYLK